MPRSNTVPIRDALRRERNVIPENRAAAVRILWPEIAPLLQEGRSYASVVSILREFNLDITPQQLRKICSRIRKSGKPLPTPSSRPIQPTASPASPNSVSFGSPPKSSDPSSAEALIARLGRDPFANIREHRKQDQKFEWNPMGNDDLLR